MSYFNYVDVETPEGKSLTSMTDKHDDHRNNDGPSSMSVVGYLEKSMEALRREVSDRPTVMRDGPSRV